MTNHPITPPPEMVEKWVRMLEYLPDKQVFSEVAQWGADQELEACCEWLKVQETQSAKWFDIRHDACALVSDLRAARRPKAPSLKEQALAALGEMSIEPCLINGVDANAAVRAKYNTIRRALEALND